MTLVHWPRRFRTECLARCLRRAKISLLIVARETLPTTGQADALREIGSDSGRHDGSVRYLFLLTEEDPLVQLSSDEETQRPGSDLEPTVFEKDGRGLDSTPNRVKESPKSAGFSDFISEFKNQHVAWPRLSGTMDDQTIRDVAAAAPHDENSTATSELEDEEDSPGEEDVTEKRAIPSLQGTADRQKEAQDWTWQAERGDGHR